MSLKFFIDNHCVGKQFDSCVESPCPFSSHSGCRHPLHPKNSKQPHEVTRKEYIDSCLKNSIGRQRQLNRSIARTMHRRLVRQALEAGKLVPEIVLKDYEKYFKKHPVKQV